MGGCFGWRLLWLAAAASACAAHAANAVQVGGLEGSGITRLVAHGRMWLGHGCRAGISWAYRLLSPPTTGSAPAGAG